jgi:methanogenic corrinoid protein MtbC1
MSEAVDGKSLQTLMAELNEDAALELAEELLGRGIEPLDIIDQCHKGMVKVGELYESGVYFISGLIMAGEIMRQIGQLVFPMLDRSVTDGDAGIILLGTVEGDIHFIGKDIFKVLAQVFGFSVHDLGVDVPPGRFVGAIHEFNPDIVGLSCLITSAFQPMKEAIEMMRTRIPEEIAPRAYIIGGRVDESLCRDVGADFWTDEAMRGVRLSQQIMGGGVEPGSPE